MKIIALSDLHGYLPDVNEIGNCDVLLIAGDIAPLQVQCNTVLSEWWMLEEFSRWVHSLKCNKVIFVAGNHDFYMEEKGPFGMNKLIHEMNLDDKLIYLKDSSYIYNDKIFYGCPWCKGPVRWAFIDETEKIYKKIPSCDVLICHQPPLYEKVGCSYPNKIDEREFGSKKLTERIEKGDIGIVVCGHIHSGIHDGVKLNDTTIYNVSIKNEQYKVEYKKTEFEI